MTDSPRKIDDVTRGEALSLLAGVSLGRIVFTENAMPAVRPASHLVADGDIIARSHDGSAIVPVGDGAPGPPEVAGLSGASSLSGVTGPERETVVAYQADDIDTSTRLGWSVVVTGPARPVLDPAEIERYEAYLPPWTDTDSGQLIRVHPGIVSAYRLAEQSA